MPKQKEKLFDAFIVEHFIGDELTGQIHWKKDFGHRIKAGAIAGYVATSGYVYMYVPRVPGHSRTCFRLHRVLWRLLKDKWPVDQLDHINGIKSDNRLLNLREATNGQNQVNSGAPFNNLLGLKGVTYMGPHRNPYRAQISYDRTTKNLGRYATPEEAHSAYLRAARNQHGEFVHAS